MDKEKSIWLETDEEYEIRSLRECKERAKKEKEFQVAQENMAEDLINLGNTTAYAIHEIVMEELEINPHLDEYDLHEYAVQSVAETIGMLSIKDFS